MRRAVISAVEVAHRSVPKFFAASPWDVAAVLFVTMVHDSFDGGKLSITARRQIVIY